MARKVRCFSFSLQPLRQFLLHRCPPMAALSPFFVTSFSPFCFRQANRHLCSQWRPPLVISCSASTGRARARRKLMSDADLRQGLLEFVSSFGFPDGHVPSTKELAQHGRKDLANIVRRRGYKIIRELLASSNEVTGGSNLEDNSAEEQNVVRGLEYDITGQGKHDKDVTEVALDLAEGVSSSEDKLQTKTESFDLDNENVMPIVPPNGSSLQEKLEKFLKCGILDFDVIEDNMNDNFWLNDSQAQGEYNKNLTGSYSLIQDQGISRVASDRNSSLLNGTAVMSKQIANTEGGNIMRDNGYLSHEVPPDADVDQYINTFEMENQAEVEQLQNKLQLKEWELSQLKELIDQEEEALSILQSQAEDEIKKTEKLISEMDAELLAAEDSLAGLKEVQIQYLGEGQLVEVAGSFNGWHHRIRLDPQPSSTGKPPIESRNLRLWSALLWLYPGEYEIKFVVDGEWKIDPARDITTRTGMQNNILRVDR